MANDINEVDKNRVDFIQNSFPKNGLFQGKAWRTTPYPVVLSKKTSKQIHELGNYLLHYLRACNTIYHQSIAGKAPDWIASYLDAGKPNSILEQGRHKAFRNAIPSVIRPDNILGDDEFA